MKLYYSRTTDIRTRRLLLQTHKSTHAMLSSMQVWVFLWFSLAEHTVFTCIQSHRLIKKSQQLLATALKFNFKTDNPSQH